MKIFIPIFANIVSLFIHYPEKSEVNNYKINYVNSMSVFSRMRVTYLVIGSATQTHMHTHTHRQTDRTFVYACQY